jgi:hypothetical protein
MHLVAQATQASMQETNFSWGMSDLCADECRKMAA